MRQRTSNWIEQKTNSIIVKDDGKQQTIEAESSVMKTSSVERVNFQARQSLLEQESFGDSKNRLKGFFTLFWVGIFVYMVNTINNNMKETGYPMKLKLAEKMSEDLLMLALADFAMICYSFIAFAIQKLLLWRIIPPFLSIILKHISQTILIFGSISIIVYRDWPWLQSSAFVAHTIVMYMKMHSYLTSNYEFHSQMIKGSSSSPIKNQYPKNVTLLNYIDYLLVPTLVYEPSYPRTEKIRISYLLQKFFFIMLTLFLLYITVQDYIQPILVDSKNLSMAESIIKLLLPFMVCYMMLFFIVFEHICNWFAEVSRFADREFYSDWWNSVTFDEFARKWNKPVHQFLLRHIYYESIKNYKFSKQNATVFTFFFSSLLHELVLTVIGRKIKFYMFMLQMIQIPLIWFGRLSFFKTHPVAGNILFWGGITLGIPLISVLYSRDHYLVE